MSLLLQDGEGQVLEAHSISAGLDYPGVGPEHSYLQDIGRAEYVAVSDEQALAALQRLSQLEGIIPALETAHALAWLDTLCPTLPSGTEVVINCSGRGDKRREQRGGAVGAEGGVRGQEVAAAGIVGVVQGVIGLEFCSDQRGQPLADHKL